MNKRLRTLFVVLAVAAFASFLAWTTLSSQKVGCQVCVEYKGGRNCATATAADERAAAREAQTTACGPLAAGMTESIACGNVTPVVRRCQAK